MAANIYVNEIDQEPEGCVVHKGLHVKAVCKSCEEPVCLRCLLDSHNGHPITDLQEAREEVCEALLRHRRALKQHIRRMEGQMKDLTDKEMENDRECGFALDNLARTGTTMKSLLALVLKEMEKEVQDRQEENRREISTTKAPLEIRLQTASSKLEEVDRLINSDSMYDTLHLEQELRKINGSHENGTHAPNVQIPKFEPKKITKEELREKLGDLILSRDKFTPEVEEDQHDYDYVEPVKPEVPKSGSLKKEKSPSPKPLSPHKRNANYMEYTGTTGVGFNTVRKTKLADGRISSVCPLTLNQAWMTDDTGKSLRLISEKGHTVRSVTANTKKSDIALTTDGAVLMTCPDKCCIKKYSQDGTIRIFINTPDYFPHGISIYFETEEIFVGLIDSDTYDVKSDSTRFIQKYSRTGEPLQQINIHKSNIVSFAFGRKVPIVTIPHKVKVNQSTGDIGLVNWTKDTQGQVIVFSPDGRKKFTYPSDNKTQFEPMDIVFTSSNFIIVSDALSCSLQMLDEEGKFVKVLHTFDTPPSALAYFGEGRLWVGNSEGELVVTQFPEPEWNSR